MLKREWQSLFKNKFLCIVLIGIITIPTIYTTIFLGSMWDPYGELEHLPVAVVNKDKSVDYDGKTMDVGNNLVDNLKDNDSLAFEFVTEEQAETGLEDGTYYMVITIPENFSENATTLMDESPKKMELEYKTNPGTNYIASKMSETAVSKIRTSVAEEVTKQYAETVFDQLGEIGDGFTEATDGTEKLGDGLEKLSDGNGKISENLTTLSDSSLTFKEGADTFQVALKTYTDGVSSANDGAGQLKAGIDTLADGTGALADGASQLSDGAGTLKGGLDTLADGAGTLADGASQLTDGSSTLKSGISTYTDGVSQVYAGTQQLVANNKALNEGVATLSNGVTTLNSGSTSLLAGLKTMSSTLGESLSKDKKTDLATLQGGISQVSQGLSDLNAAVSSVDVSKVPTLVNKVKGGMESVGSDATKAATHVGTAIAKKAAARESVEANEGFKSLSKEDQEKILAAFDVTDSELSGAMSDLKNAGTTLTGLQEGLKESNLTEDKLDQIATLQDSVAKLEKNGTYVLSKSSEAITSLQTGLENIQDALERKGTTPQTMGLIQGMTAVSEGVKQLDTGVNAKQGLQASVKTYTAGVETVNAGLKTLNENSSALNSGSTKLAGGLSALNEKVPTLTGGIGQLQEGATKLSSGLSSLNEKVPTLTAGISKLQDGSTQLAAGTSKLTANNAAVMEAIAKLDDGASKISDGSGKLADASETLGEGLTTAKDGVTELNTKLSDAADEINSKKTSEKTNEMFATPVETSGSEMTSVDNNGNAMAAYMMSVALWVGCLAFSIMYPLAGSAGKVKSGFRWWLSKASVASLIAGIQAVVMVFMLKSVLGFNPAYFGKTLLIAILASFAFMTIFYFGNLLLGKIGSFILLIFMVLQLGGSAGTYPIELSSGFYKAIHPFMPFTYSVNAFRATIATGASIAQPIAVFVSIIVVCTGLTIMIFEYKAKKVMGQESVEAIDPLLGEMAE
ncbi:MAG: YhgE/Pip domain-containing protein [bacterium]|nr:YhgE/Pip domain-containing protein [bacterium]